MRPGTKKRAAAAATRSHNKRTKRATQRASLDDTQNHGDLTDAETSELELDDETVLEDAAQIMAAIPHVLETLNKKDFYPEEFEKKVIGDRDRLAKLFEDGTVQRDREKDEFETIFRNLLVEALIPPGFSLPDDSAGAIPTNVFASMQPLHQKSSFLLEKSADLFKEYDSITAEASALQRPQDLATIWVEENEKAVRLIQAGKVAVGVEIQTMLGHHDRLAKKKIIDPDLEDGVDSMLRMGKGKDQEEEAQETEGWGNVACGVEKGFNQLYKVIAEEIE